MDATIFLDEDDIREGAPHVDPYALQVRFLPAVCAADIRSVKRFHAVVNADPPPCEWSGTYVRFGPSEEGEMARKRHGAEEIIGKLREAEVLLAKGRSVADAAKAIGVTEVTSRVVV
ncbi:MAG: hypothetical protein N2378_07345 [Chloroflexaceae bacterium]|nr:hypothetical protein [Chloroflexaceae bacterium]